MYFHWQQFKLHALLQLRYVDPRLVFRKVSPRRNAPIIGQSALRDSLWTPHIFFANERASSVLGTPEKDVLTSVSPDGTVIISTRIQATLHCWMNLQKYPFDEQKCNTVFESCSCVFMTFSFVCMNIVMRYLTFRDVQYIWIGTTLGRKIPDHNGTRTPFNGIQYAEHVDEWNHRERGLKRFTARRF